CRALRSRIVICMLTALRLRLTSVTTLFPFTTLFRSREHPVPRGRQRDGLGRLSRGGPALLGCTACPVLGRPQSKSNPTRAPEAADRKSTRLNSSHVKISYAVFCLKKNNATMCSPNLI